MSDTYVSPADLREQHAATAPPLVIDVRSDEEYAAGHIPDALHIPGDQLPRRMHDLTNEHAIVTY